MLTKRLDGHLQLQGTPQENSTTAAQSWTKREDVLAGGAIYAGLKGALGDRTKGWRYGQSTQTHTIHVSTSCRIHNIFLCLLLVVTYILQFNSWGRFYPRGASV